MRQTEARQQIIRILLQAEKPLGLPDIAKTAGLSEKGARRILEELCASDHVVEGKLIPGCTEALYRWATRWQSEIGGRSAETRKQIREALDSIPRPEGVPDIESEPARLFQQYVIDEYLPPGDKRFLVFFQCSVRRPFSTSPSQASMRRAIAVATGYDPAKDFEACPVHVVVLASKIGPVPYELEDLYPANVPSIGVKQFSPEEYARVKPILATRIAEYILAHCECYDRISTFTEGRYAEVMEEARRIVRDSCKRLGSFAILPTANGARIVRMGKSKPRKYWEKYWIQLYREVTGWLSPAGRKEADQRLANLDIEWR